MVPEAAPVAGRVQGAGAPITHAWRPGTGPLLAQPWSPCSHGSHWQVPGHRSGEAEHHWGMMALGRQPCGALERNPVTPQGLSPGDSYPSGRASEGTLGIVQLQGSYAGVGAWPQGQPEEKGPQRLFAQLCVCRGEGVKKSRIHQNQDRAELKVMS